MKKSTLFALLSAAMLLPALLFAQAPAIQWNKLYGGSQWESSSGGKAITQTSDGGYIMAAFSQSSQTGDVTGTLHSVQSDCWIIKIDATGNKQWDKLLGGTGPDIAYSIQQTIDGGYIVAAISSSSQSGDVTDPNHGTNDNNDIWLIKLAANGDKQWDKLLGGDEYEGYFSTVQQTADGGYIVGGFSRSSQSGNVSSTNHGATDFLVLKLDASGAKQWDKLLGGSAFETLFDIQQTSDGGYIVAGSSESSQSGDVTGINHGTPDCWVVKLDAGGTKQWDKLLGGNGWEEPSSILQTSDGGYIMAASSILTNQDGDVSGTNHGTTDFWIVKMDAAGTKTWDKLYGGNVGDFPRSIQQTKDGGYVIAGTSESNQNGDVTGIHHGLGLYEDIWVLKIDANGTKEWDKVMGGSQPDIGPSIQQTTDGGFIIGAASGSSDGDIAAGTSHGSGDLWIIKLAPAASGGALPVTLVSFTAKQQDEKVLLNWVTATEQNTKDFIIQRSNDGISWSDIGTVNASGNSNIIVQYSFVDAQPAGSNIYRLLQRDLDNKSAFSDTRIVNLNNQNADLRLLGNPVSNGSLLLDLKTRSTISIFNIQGMQVFKKQLTAGRQIIPVNNYSKGIYTIKTTTGSKLFVIQ